MRYHVVVGNETDTGSRPYEYENNKGHVFERRRETVVQGFLREFLRQFLTCVERQQGGNDILDTSSGVGAGDPHQKRNITRGDGQYCRRDQSQKREQQSTNEKGIFTIVSSQKQLFQIIAQSDGDDWKRGAERENWKQG